METKDILIQEYLRDLNENYMEFLNEDFKSFINSIGLSKIKQTAENLKNSIKDEGIEKSKKIVDSLHIPKMSMKSIEDTFSKISPDFKKYYIMSKQVIKNSIDDIPEILIPPVSAAITFKSTYKSEDPLNDTKENLKEFINKYNINENSVGDVASSIFDKIFKLLIFSMASFIILVLLSSYHSILSCAAILLCVGYMFAQVAAAGRSE